MKQLKLEDIQSDFIYKNSIRTKFELKEFDKYAFYNVPVIERILLLHLMKNKFNLPINFFNILQSYLNNDIHKNIYYFFQINTRDRDNIWFSYDNQFFHKIEIIKN